MPSWVRYSVAVYVGLLFAGSLAGPNANATIGAGRVETDSTVVFHVPAAHRTAHLTSPTTTPPPGPTFAQPRHAPAAHSVRRSAPLRSRRFRIS